MTELERLLQRRLDERRRNLAGHAGVRERWVLECRAIARRIADWLRPLETKGYVDVSFVATPIHEELLGDYEAEGVRLVFVDERVLSLVPVARHVLGADGRIDVMSINACLAMLIRRDGEWCFARREERTGPPLTWKLNRDSFHDFLVGFIR
ncbi:MAG: hypothetical protein OXI55_05915 [Gammaproteobacteria bacterium]|nr:hypothetical protein [Gammaproteobacteria bacterium]